MLYQNHLDIHAKLFVNISEGKITFEQITTPPTAGGVWGVGRGNGAGGPAAGGGQAIHNAPASGLVLAVPRLKSKSKGGAELSPTPPLYFFVLFLLLLLLFIYFFLSRRGVRQKKINK